jgi:hypothetical protein
LISFRKSSSTDFFHQNLVIGVFSFSINDQQTYFITNWPKNDRWQEVISQMETQTDKNELEIDLKS